MSCFYVNKYEANKNNDIFLQNNLLFLPIANLLVNTRDYNDSYVQSCKQMLKMYYTSYVLLLSGKKIKVSLC